MRRLIFQVAVGEVPAFYGPCMESVRQYAARIGADYEALSEPELRIVPKKSQRSENALRLGYLPIFEKEAGFGRLGFTEKTVGYDQVCILDADVYVRDCAPNIFDVAEGFDFAGVRECDLPLQPQFERKIVNYAKDQYGDKNFHFYNMGVTVWSANVLTYLNGETPKQFIERPEFEKFVNGEGKYRWSTDQTLLNTWVRKSGMTTRCLEWRWNCMYDYVIPTALRQEPYFVHFALAANMPHKGAEIPDIIARMG
jgi:hypothetical protein